ncbi:hypothetical protein AB9E28_34955, partial [Rhizobium leguminosarum]
FLPQYRAAGSFEEIRGLTGTSRIFALLSGTAVLAAGMLGLHFFVDMIQVYYLVPIFIGLLAMPMIARLHDDRTFDIMHDVVAETL